MLSLPKATEYDRRIPKTKFYENISITPALKKVFTERIKAVYWKNKIAETTVNIKKGESVTEIELFSIKLNAPSADEAILRQIDREIPYHLIFVFEHEGKIQVWIGYKEEVKAGTAAFKVSGYYHTEWIEENEFKLKIEGLDLDSVYESFVRQVAGSRLREKEEGEGLKQSVEREKQISVLKKKIAAYEAKIRKEKQLNRQMQLNREKKELIKKLEELE